MTPLLALFLCFTRGHYPADSAPGTFRCARCKRRYLVARAGIARRRGP